MEDVKPLRKSFADYKGEGHLWITLARGLYYPDYLEQDFYLVLCGMITQD